MELTERIRAALDETERVARAALSHPTQYNPATQEEDRTGTDDGVWSVGHFASDHSVVEGMGIHIYDEGGHTEEQAMHIALHDPERELRMVAAHRQILDLHEPSEYRILRNGVTQVVLQCNHCASLCHSGSGLSCDEPCDAPYPCETVQIVAAALQVEV